MKKFVNSLVRTTFALAIIAGALHYPLRWAMSWQEIGIPNNDEGFCYCIGLYVIAIILLFLGIYLLCPAIWYYMRINSEGDQYECDTLEEQAEQEALNEEDKEYYKKRLESYQKIFLW